MNKIYSFLDNASISLKSEANSLTEIIFSLVVPGQNGAYIKPLLFRVAAKKRQAWQRHSILGMAISLKGWCRKKCNSISYS